jgi:hypothetical protein
MLIDISRRIPHADKGTVGNYEFFDEDTMDAY